MNLVLLVFEKFIEVMTAWQLLVSSNVFGSSVLLAVFIAKIEVIGIVDKDDGSCLWMS